MRTHFFILVPMAIFIAGCATSYVLSDENGLEVGRYDTVEEMKAARLEMMFERLEDWRERLAAREAEIEAEIAETHAELDAKIAAIDAAELAAAADLGYTLEEWEELSIADELSKVYTVDELQADLKDEIGVLAADTIGLSNRLPGCYAEIVRMSRMSDDLSDDLSFQLMSLYSGLMSLNSGSYSLLREQIIRTRHTMLYYQEVLESEDFIRLAGAVVNLRNYNLVIGMERRRLEYLYGTDGAC